MKKAISAIMAAVLTAMILLYARVYCFVPAQGQGEEISLDTGDQSYRGKEPYRKCSETGSFPAFTGTAEKNLPAVSLCFVQGRIGVADFTVESLLPKRLSKAGKPVWAGDLRLEEWKQAYLSYIYSEGRYMRYCTFSLIYVDDDDIPELMIDTGFEAGGCYILTFHDHELDVWQSGRLNVTYIERGGLVCNSDGNMGYYYDNVYAIRDGKWVFVDGGTWGDGPHGVQLDENGNIMEFFYWDDEELTREAYETRLNAIYPAGQGIYPEQYYIRDEICSLLRTRDVATAGHRYELVVGDVTWKEAETLCWKKGGYLATITSQEELWRIQEQMIAEDKTDITFFVGANNDSSYVGYRWLEPGTEEGYDMLDLSHALWRPFWLEGGRAQLRGADGGWERGQGGLCGSHLPGIRWTVLACRCAGKFPESASLLCGQGGIHL